VWIDLWVTSADEVFMEAVHQVVGICPIGAVQGEHFIPGLKESSHQSHDLVFLRLRQLQSAVVVRPAVVVVM
jgi:hypothetical protein